MKKNRSGFWKNINKYSYTELVSNWCISVWPIVFLGFYTPVLSIYGSKIYAWVQHETVIWPLADWIMYMLAILLLLWIVIWVTKWQQMIKRKSWRRNYKTVEMKRAEKLRKIMTGTSDGTFSGIKSKAPKGFN